MTAATANPTTSIETLYLAKPRGFCAGVERAIDVVEETLKYFPAPIYVFHEIVHNTHVVKDLSQKGAVFVNEVAETPDGGVLIFSAHGISPEVRAQAKAKRLAVIDATCPLVTKVHLEAIRFAKDGYTILLVGHANHDEVIGTMGEAPDKIVLVETVEDVQNLPLANDAKVAVITQTTLSLDDCQKVIDAIKTKFTNVKFPPKSDICYATQNRQTAVKKIAKVVDLILVIGSKNSSNSARLAEVSRDLGTDAYLIDDVSHIKPEWLMGKKKVAITAGASAPENLVQDVVDYFKKLGITDIQDFNVIEEDVKFGLPRELLEIANKSKANTKDATAQV
ncbi:MAG: 4-hydroxy-3-methylbut-2-enyl diphosphate reductase [Deltaproteobacteria bacterium CG11_big_fil_rev_8_21_14_0_20_47_16]|nr:MAG: 4-hydroxy-3-methylbut-2-enyl diphosphate reductase [Deltaproteobacteria bacterium CG11_big_fil_rev_8_21_14_0_20_47_16]